jgi:hypothetical protein
MITFLKIDMFYQMKKKYDFKHTLYSGGKWFVGENDIEYFYMLYVH